MANAVTPQLKHKQTRSYGFQILKVSAEACSTDIAAYVIRGASQP